MRRGRARGSSERLVIDLWGIVAEVVITMIVAADHLLNSP